MLLKAVDVVVEVDNAKPERVVFCRFVMGNNHFKHSVAAAIIDKRKEKCGSYLVAKHKA